jgi:hypothetical protein
LAERDGDEGEEIGAAEAADMRNTLAARFHDVLEQEAVSFQRAVAEGETVETAVFVGGQIAAKVANHGEIGFMYPDLATIVGRDREGRRCLIVAPLGLVSVVLTAIPARRSGS